MSEKHGCGKFLSFCPSCRTIYCAKCQNGAAHDTTCPTCGQGTGAGNVNEVTFKIANHDYS